ncbi:hypothetical protein D3C78_1683200 [compost metagenome]
MGDDPAQFVQAILGLVGNDAVGTIIDSDGTALVSLATCRIGRTGHRLEQPGDIGGLGIVHLDQLATQRRQFGNLLLRLQLLAFARGDLVSRRHQ